MKCGKKLSLYYRQNLGTGVDRLDRIEKSLRAFCGYLEPERHGGIFLWSMDLGVHASIDLIAGLLRECGKPSGKHSKTM